ncbi:hypothetical protein KRR23_28190, partial [Pseudomonas sp. CVAP|uniref:hypothetical protein n=1 Tax=Pseudomonas sp. CVAP\
VIVKIKFRNPNCESSWGFVLPARKCSSAAPTSDRRFGRQGQPLGKFRLKWSCSFWYGAARFLMD